MPTCNRTPTPFQVILVCVHLQTADKSEAPGDLWGKLKQLLCNSLAPEGPPSTIASNIPCAKTAKTVVSGLKWPNIMSWQTEAHQIYAAATFLNPTQRRDNSWVSKLRPWIEVMLANCRDM